MARNFLTSALLHVSRSRLMYAGGLTSLGHVADEFALRDGSSSVALS